MEKKKEKKKKSEWDKKEEEADSGWGMFSRRNEWTNKVLTVWCVSI
jgi:hypothetical protein